MNFSSCLFSITSAWRSKHITIDHQHLGSHKDNKYTILQQNLVSAQNCEILCEFLEIVAGCGEAKKGLAEARVKQHQQSVGINMILVVYLISIK